MEVEELQEKRLVPSGSSEGEEQKQERQFHEAFRDEADLVRQTMRHLTDEKPAAKGLWAPVLNEQPTAEFLSSPTRMDSGSSVPKGGLSPNLDELVDQWLSKAVPPIVERMVQERLDKLLSEAENQPEIKP